MFDKMLFQAQFITGQSIRVHTADGPILDSCNANIGVLKGKARTVPAILCDGVSDTDQWRILNIVNHHGMFLDHVAIKGAVSDDQAMRLCQKYLTEANAGQIQDHVEVSNNALKTFLDSTKLPSNTAYFLENDAALLDSQGTVSPVQWNDDNELISHGGRFSHMMLDMAGCDIDGELLEQVSPRDVVAMLIDESCEFGGMLDAIIIKYNKLDMVTNKLAEALKASDNEDFFVKTVTPIEPFKRQGVVNVGAIFEMSDSQTITVLFNNPDTTPAKLTGTDVLTSWKWILNKRDVTAILQPKAVNARKYPQIASRMLKVLAKNHARFKRAQMARSREELLLEELIGQVEAAQAELRLLQQTGLDIQGQIDQETTRKQQETDSMLADQAKADAAAQADADAAAQAQADAAQAGEDPEITKDRLAQAAVTAKVKAIVDILVNEHDFSISEDSDPEHIEVDSESGRVVGFDINDYQSGWDFEISSRKLGVESISTEGTVEYIAKMIAQRDLEYDLSFDNESLVEDKDSPFLGKTSDYVFTIEQLNKAALSSGLKIVFDNFEQSQATGGLFDSIAYNSKLVYGITAQIGKDGAVWLRAKVDFDGNLELLKDATGNEVHASFTFDQATAKAIAVKLNEAAIPAQAPVSAAAPTITGEEFGEFDLPEDNKELRAVVKQALAEMVGKNFPCPALNADVEIRTNGMKKIISNSADVRKLQAVAALKELLADAIKIDEKKPYDKLKEQNIVAYHFLESPLQLKDELLKVTFVIREDDKGHYHYDHRINSDVVKNAKSPLLDGLLTATFPMAGVSQDDLAKLIRLAGCQLDSSIEINQSNVNTMLDSVAASGTVLNMFIKAKQNVPNEQNVQMNSDELFLKGVIDGTIDLTADATGEKLEQMGENLDPALEQLFDQAIDAYSQAALNNAQSMG